MAVRYRSFLLSLFLLSLFLLSVFLLAHTSWAQQEAVPGEDQAGNAAAQGTKAAEAAPAGEAAERTAEEREEANRVREAITENLVPERPADVDDETPEDGTDTVLDADAEAAAPPTEASDVPDAEVDAKDVVPEAPAEELWWERFADIATRLQRVPERIPPLAGKGWIHFGRVEFEGARFSDGILKDDSGFNFRSLRGGLLRQWNDNLLVKLEIDLTDGDSNFTDLYGRYNTKLGVFTIGNQRIAQTLVNQTSRLSRTFMEEPLPADAFGLGRRLGLGWDLKLKRIGAHLTAFGPDLNENIGKFGYGIRAHANPTLNQFNMIHIGASAVQERMDRDAQFRAYPESRVTDTRLVDTGRFEDVDTQSIIGLELAAARKNTSFRSEVFRARWDRDGGDRSFKGVYVQVNAILTGESFRYAQGKFLRVKPTGNRGAWELGLRYSTVDLRDEDVDGGRQNNTTLALNWYAPGEQLRVMGNIVYVDADLPDGGRETPWIFQLRAQVNW